MRFIRAIAIALGALAATHAGATPLAVYPGAGSNPSCVANPVGTTTETGTEEERDDGAPGAVCRARTCDRERTIYTCPGGAPPVAGAWSTVACDPWRTWTCGNTEEECRANPVSTSTQTRWVERSTPIQSGPDAGQCLTRECEEAREHYECTPPQADLYGSWALTGTCRPWRPPAACATPTPALCPASETEQRACPGASGDIQTRTRALLADGSPCVWDAWSAWTPACPAPVCTPPSETERRACTTDPTVEQTRTRLQTAASGACAWEAWSPWTPACPATACTPPSETERRACASNPVVEQTRTRLQTAAGGVCAWEPWSPWTPDCPATACTPPSETERRACASNPAVEQTRTRLQTAAGGVCAWEPWSAWTPDCPTQLTPPDPPNPTRDTALRCDNFHRGSDQGGRVGNNQSTIVFDCDLSWDTVAGATGYELQVRTDGRPWDCPAHDRWGTYPMTCPVRPRRGARTGSGVSPRSGVWDPRPLRRPSWSGEPLDTERARSISSGCGPMVPVGTDRGPMWPAPRPSQCSPPCARRPATLHATARCASKASASSGRVGASDGAHGTITPAAAPSAPQRQRMARASGRGAHGGYAAQAASRARGVRR